ncbi:hypothetical protein BBBOND_0211910 [Babesia bigemina]|uniref:Uncharacterized protein n=1 Tax=Babesia bigemina TaxID=5866 RepID=A0A061DAU9_BABBI|nr:hypothetical protein BBBOND_0211910 [Babesia bigemina]CDR96049.1 hypothetical protein BBBOND_0211910 [Babesia bigemina]|eukprot:XP_012768235.1 hypothetical protein BBBOND_0211910 [Babesia bigemina]
MVHNSLNDVPRNLKEGIDWLMALKGADGEKNLSALGAAIHNFLSYNLLKNPEEAKKLPSLENVKLISMGFMWKKQLRDLWPANEMLGKFIKTMSQKPTDLVNAIGSDPDEITANLTRFVDGCEKFLDGIKSTADYESAYSSEATWDASCSKLPEACAAVFVGIAPMLYVGLESMRDAGENQSIKWMPFIKKKNLGEVMNAMGYEDPVCREGMTGPYLTTALKNVNRDVLEIIHGLCGFDVLYASETPEPVKADKPVEPVSQSTEVEEPLVAEESLDVVKAERFAESVEVDQFAEIKELEQFAGFEEVDQFAEIEEVVQAAPLAEAEEVEEPVDVEPIAEPVEVEQFAGVEEPVIAEESVAQVETQPSAKPKKSGKTGKGKTGKKGKKGVSGKKGKKGKKAVVANQ